MTIPERIARAIALLTDNGYRVTLLRPRGHPVGSGLTVDREKLHRLHSDGVAVPEIAAQCDCAESTVYAILRGTR